VEVNVPNLSDSRVLHARCVFAGLDIFPALMALFGVQHFVASNVVLAAFDEEQLGATMRKLPQGNPVFSCIRWIAERARVPSPIRVLIPTSS
jgi:hypothetical protein